MKNIFRIIALIALISVAGLFVAVPAVSAVGLLKDCTIDDDGTDDCESGLVCDTTAEKCIAQLPEGPQGGVAILEIINRVSNWVFGIFLAIATIFIVIAAFEFVTGTGDPTKIQAAKQKLMYALVGIGLALIANGMDDVVRTIINP